jgi:hypothetical protein
MSVWLAGTPSEAFLALRKSSSGFRRLTRAGGLAESEAARD